MLLCVISQFSPLGKGMPLHPCEEGKVALNLLYRQSGKICLCISGRIVLLGPEFPFFSSRYLHEPSKLTIRHQPLRFFHAECIKFRIDELCRPKSIKTLGEQAPLSSSYCLVINQVLSIYINAKFLGRRLDITCLDFRDGLQINQKRVQGNRAYCVVGAII